MTEKEYKENHNLKSLYTMDGNSKPWKIAYYPLYEDGKTGEVYETPRALVEQPSEWDGVKGTDFREVPLVYLTPVDDIELTSSTS